MQQNMKTVEGCGFAGIVTSNGESNGKEMETELETGAMPEFYRNKSITLWF